MTYQPNKLKQLFHTLRRTTAKHWLSIQPAIQIALTGSQGKTNTTNVLYHVLSGIGKTAVTDLNLDTNYNVPITALKVNPLTHFVIFELGIDHRNEMDRYLEIVKPKIAIITGIAPVHTDKEHLGSIDNVIMEKRKLIETLPQNGYAILNFDDINVRNMAPYTNANIIWYGTDEKHCDFWVDPKTIQLSLKGTKFYIHSNHQSPVSNLQIATKLIGKHHIYTIMASYATLYAIQKLSSPNLNPLQFNIILEEIKPLEGRMNVENGPLGTIILNDSLRANPASTKSGLETLSDMKYEKGHKIAILAEMGELEHPEEEHANIGTLIAKLNIDYTICIGPLHKNTYDSAVKNGFDKKRIFWIKNAIEAAEVAKKIVKSGDLLYTKGSILRHVERVKLILEGVKVGCNVTLCPFYQHCIKCSYLETGYQNSLS